MDFGSIGGNDKGSLSIAGAPMTRSNSHCFGSSNSLRGPAVTMEPDDQRVAPYTHTHKHTLSGASPVQPSPLTRLIVSSTGLLAVCWVISNESLDDCQSEVMSLKLSQTSKETRGWNIYTPRDKITTLLCCACHANCSL